MELCLTNKLIEKTMSRRVQLTRYISAQTTLRYGTSRVSNFHRFHKDEIGHFSSQVDGQPLENLKGMLYSYENALRFS